MNCALLFARLRSSAAAFVLLAALAQVAHDQQSQLPPDADRTMAQAIAFVEQTFIAKPGEIPIQKRARLAALARSFSGSLDRLSTQVGPARCEQMKAAEGRDIETKLAAIACDRKQRREAYAEIQRVYVKGVHSTESVFPRSPEVKDVHAAENYRLPWEFYLLTPEPEGASPLYQFRVTVAIGLIHNRASLITLLHAFRITTLEGVDREAIKERQRLLLSSLNFFANEPALRAMLESLALSQRQPGGPAWDVRDYIFRLLTDQEGFDNGAEWKKVIAAFPKSNLRTDQRQLLESALRALNGVQ